MKRKSSTTKQKLINRDEFLQRMKYVKETVTKIIKQYEQGG